MKRKIKKWFKWKNLVNKRGVFKSCPVCGRPIGVLFIGGVLKINTEVWCSCYQHSFRFKKSFGRRGFIFISTLDHVREVKEKRKWERKRLALEK
jgi:hypothetical protein